MTKDPAFLFYSKDWLEGTAELSPCEKGIYIDLLCHQHQKGSLPSDTKRLAKLCGLSELEFMENWEAVKIKFNRTVDRTDDRLVNQRLVSVVEERASKAHKNAILSRFAVLIKKSSQLTTKQILQIKSKFNVYDYVDYEISEATERLTKRFSEWLLDFEPNGKPNGHPNGIKNG
jgi:uncharacterized protein YdaU (DUF1376 family)